MFVRQIYKCEQKNYTNICTFKKQNFTLQAQGKRKGNSLAFSNNREYKKYFQIWKGKKDKVTLQYINHNNM